LLAAAHGRFNSDARATGGIAGGSGRKKDIAGGSGRKKDIAGGLGLR
jgi:hypothetical protein